MPPPVCSRVAIRIGFGRLPPACAREGKDHGDTDAHCARYQETRPAGAVACADSAASSRGSRRPARLAGSRSPDRASGESVIRTSSATMPLTFGNPANKLLLRRSSRFISLAGKQNTREHPSRSRNQRLDDELTSTKTAIAPLCILCKAVISFLMRFLRW